MFAGGQNVKMETLRGEKKWLKDRKWDTLEKKETDGKERREERIHKKSTLVSVGGVMVNSGDRASDVTVVWDDKDE